MKTDREFIEGIYKKAQLLGQQEQNLRREPWYLGLLRFNREKKRVPAFAVSLATFAVFALVIIAGGQANRSPNIDNIGDKQIRGIEGQDPKGVANISAYGLGEEVPIEDSFTILGKVTDVVDAETRQSINIQVLKLLYGEGAPDYLTITEGLPLTLAAKITHGTNVIITVMPIFGQEGYALFDENSIYFYTKDENNQKLYEAMDGTIVTEESFVE